MGMVAAEEAEEAALMPRRGKDAVDRWVTAAPVTTGESSGP